MSEKNKRPSNQKTLENPNDLVEKLNQRLKERPTANSRHKSTMKNWNEDLNSVEVEQGEISARLEEAEEAKETKGAVEVEREGVKEDDFKEYNSRFADYKKARKIGGKWTKGKGRLFIWKEGRARALKDKSGT